jgi:hypothetical protein
MRFGIIATGGNYPWQVIGYPALCGRQEYCGLWDLIGRLVDIFQPDECADYSKSCGYEPE